MRLCRDPAGEQTYSVADKKNPAMFWLKHAVHLLTCMSPHITPTHQSTQGQSMQTERGRVMVVRRVTERGEERRGETDIQRRREKEREKGIEHAVD